MIVGAFTAILIFRGFSHYMLTAIEKTLTEAQHGHIQIATPSVWNNDLPQHKNDAYLEHHAELIKSLEKIPEVRFASGRVSSFVLLTNGDRSVAAQAIGFNPDVEITIEKALTFTEGAEFSKGQKFEILVSAGLQKSLQLNLGQTVSLVSQTVDGSMSSLDLEVKGIVITGNSDIDNSTVYVPLIVMQKLQGTDRVERVAVLLKSDANLDTTLSLIKQDLRRDPQLVARSWKESVVVFRQLTDFYNVQNTLVEVILSCLVFLGILNTLGMSIYERIGEIGTLRALGDQVSTVLIQLIFEGLLLGLMGALIAVPISALIGLGISALEIQVLLPGASIAMPIHIDPNTFDFLLATAIVTSTGILASLWPSQKAVRLRIVDALRANS